MMVPTIEYSVDSFSFIVHHLSIGYFHIESIHSIHLSLHLCFIENLNDLFVAEKVGNVFGGSAIDVQLVSIHFHHIHQIVHDLHLIPFSGLQSEQTIDQSICWNIYWNFFLKDSQKSYSCLEYIA